MFISTFTELNVNLTLELPFSVSRRHADWQTGGGRLNRDGPCGKKMLCEGKKNKVARLSISDYAAHKLVSTMMGLLCEKEAHNLIYSSGGGSRRGWRPVQASRVRFPARPTISVEKVVLNPMPGCTRCTRTSRPGKAYEKTPKEVIPPSLWKISQKPNETRTE
jgi:hypothetical protein